MRKHETYRQSVRWADASFDASRTCDECGKDNCKYPVHNDYYKEVVTKKSYWNWMESNNLKEDGNGGFSHDGE